MKNKLIHCVQFSFFFPMFFLIGMMSCKGNTPFPDEDGNPVTDKPSLTEDYEVWINGVKDSVYVARVQDPPFNKEKTGLDFGGDYYFASFDVDKPIEVKIKSKKKLTNVVLRPERAQVKNLKRSENELSFVVDEPSKLIIEPTGKNNPILLFANPPDEFIPDLNDPNLIYYGTGIHYPEGAVINLKSNQTLYLAEGAIVKGAVRLNVGASNVTIRGRGIIDGNEFEWGKSKNLILMERNNHIVIKDVILRGSSTWTMSIWNSQDITINNVKIVGARTQNDDGIDLVNSKDVSITNCFIRTDDDCIALKGSHPVEGSNTVERITVENSILWCDRARIFLLGHESQSEYMKDLLFKNIDIVHFSMTPFLLEPGENMFLEEAIFEDIRINGEGQDVLIRLNPTVNDYMLTKVPGYIRNITFKNIQVSGKGGSYKIQILGYDQEHDVRNVNLTDIFILGQKVTSNSANLGIGNYVSGINIQ